MFKILDSTKKLNNILGAISMPKMPAIYISKYNRFVDNIIGRINRILGKSYDPVRVKLDATPANKTKSKKGTKKRSGQQKIGGIKNHSKPKEVHNKMAELPIARSGSKGELLSSNMNKQRSMESESREPAFILISKTGTSDIIKNVTVKSETRAGPNKNQQNKNAYKNKKNNNKNNSNKNNNKNNKNKTKQSNSKNKTPKARATLYGLSSIKRDGDVTVNMMSDHTSVKTNFIVGPLTLRVEREIGRGAKRELKSATATTAEMFGRLNLKIVHGGAATLNSIRVLQPKQVRVESTDDHDKTKEFMWKRSSNIAYMVSQKLASATRSMLKPPPRA